MTDEGSDFAEAWRPDAGDTITGTMVGVEVIDPNNQGPYPCVTLKTGSGEIRAIHAFHQVLRNGIARRRPKIGDELTITYHGKKEGGAYGGYHSYQVTGGQTVEMNWESWLPEEERGRAGSAEPPIAPNPPFAPASALGGSLGGATADDFSPLPPSNEPSVQEKAASKFGAEVPF